MKGKIIGISIVFIILISVSHSFAINKPIKKELEQQFIAQHYKPNSFFVKDNYFFELTGTYEYPTISIHDISKPYFKKFISNYSLNQTGAIQKLLFKDDIMYILFFDEFEGAFDYVFYQVSYAIELVNISDITNPTFISRLDIAGVNEQDYHDFEISGNYCYLMSKDFNTPNITNMFHIINFTDIYNPNIVAIYSFVNAEFCWMEFRNDNLFLLSYHDDDNSSLTIWDISNKTDWNRLYLEEFIDTQMQGLFLKDDYAFFFSNDLENSNDFYQYSISNLSDASLQRTIQFSQDNDLRTITFWDDYMGVVSDDGYRTYVTDEIETNQSLDYFGSFIKDDGYFYDGTYDNNRVYLSRWSWEKANRIFFILDVTDPYNIQMIYPRNPYVISIVPPVVILTSIFSTIIILILIKRRK